MIELLLLTLLGLLLALMQVVKAESLTTSVKEVTKDNTVISELKSALKLVANITPKQKYGKSVKHLVNTDIDVTDDSSILKTLIELKIEKIYSLYVYNRVYLLSTVKLPSDLTIPEFSFILVSIRKTALSMAIGGYRFFPQQKFSRLSITQPKCSYCMQKMSYEQLELHICEVKKELLSNSKAKASHYWNTANKKPKY